MLMDWFNGLGLAGQIFLAIATPSSVILVIQIVMMLIGLGGDADGDLDIDGDGIPDNGIDGVFGNDAPDDLPDTPAEGLSDLQFFSLRSIMAFLTTFGWMGVSLVSAGLPIAACVAIALVCGVAIMVGVAFMMRALYRLQSDGTADIRQALGVSGSVYMTIPAARAGVGKVNILLQGSLVEREAMTDDETPLTFGTEVTVVSILGGTTLLVTKK